MQNFLAEFENIHHENMNISLQLKESTNVLVKYSHDSELSLFYDFLCARKKPEKGKIFFKGQNINGLNYNETISLRSSFRNIGITEPHLVVNLNVFENITLAYEYKENSKDYEKIYDLAKKIGIYEILSKMPSLLSKPEYLLVYVLMLTIDNPKFLVIKENIFDDNKAISIIKNLSNTNFIVARKLKDKGHLDFINFDKELKIGE